MIDTSKDAVEAMAFEVERLTGDRWSRVWADETAATLRALVAERECARTSVAMTVQDLERRHLKELMEGKHDLSAESAAMAGGAHMVIDALNAAMACGLHPPKHESVSGPVAAHSGEQE